MPKIKKRVILGITGGIACGKTTVMRMLAKRRIASCSADEMAHECIRLGTPAYRAILSQFGNGVLGADREIDRKSLGRIVFSDSGARRHLERIVHPCVLKRLKRFVEGKKGLVALDIPLLFEAGYDRWMDRVWVVSTSRDQQIRRLGRRNKLSRAEAIRRIGAQLPLSVKRRRADSVLHNDGTMAKLARQVTRLLEEIKNA